MATPTPHPTPLDAQSIEAAGAHVQTLWSDSGGGFEAGRGRENGPEVLRNSEYYTKAAKPTRPPRSRSAAVAVARSQASHRPLDGTETAAELARRLRSALAPRCEVCGRYVRPTCGRCSGRCHTRAHRRRRRLQTNPAGVAG